MYKVGGSMWFQMVELVLVVGWLLLVRIEKTASFRQSLSGALFPFGNIAALLRNLYVR